VAAGLLVATLGAWFRDNRARASAGFCVAAMGLTMIGLEILLLLAFQAVYGYVYEQLAMVIAGFMAGLAAGAWWGVRRGRANEMRLLTILQTVGAICPLLLYALLIAVTRLAQPVHLVLMSQVLFPLSAVLCGLPGGSQFAIASRIYFAQPTTRDRSIGSLYGLDLAGSCIGAVVLSAYLIPVYGFLRTSLLMALVNLAPALAAAASMRNPTHVAAPLFRRA